MLHIALVIENSDIHLGHLLRFIREYRITHMNVSAHVPKELKVVLIPKWVHFLRSRYTEGGASSVKVKLDSEMLMKALDLGKPNIPHVKKIIDEYVVELCLPTEFSKLVYSLMLKIPWKVVSLEIVSPSRYPNYGIWAMAYVVLALKIAFGLDDFYENQLSDAVDMVNEGNSHVKLYRFDDFSVDSTDRLFSFRDWLNFVRFRSMVLAKLYLPHAVQTNSDIDDYTLLMHIKKECAKESIGDISDAVTMDMLKKMSSQISSEFRNCSIDFPTTLTPLSQYTGIIASKINEPHLRAVLTEDFSKYSMKYCTVDFNLEVNSSNVVAGVDETNKFQQDDIYSEDYSTASYDKTMVFIRNCDNKNWLNTRPPKLQHVSRVCEDEDSNDKSDQGYDSNQENTDEFVKVDKCDTDVPEECEDNNIFDDLFDDIETDQCFNDPQNVTTSNVTLNDLESDIKTEPEDIPESRNGDFEHYSVAESFVNKNDPEELSGFDEATFNKEDAIKELVTAACRKYNITLPSQYKDGVGKKRKAPPPKKEGTEVKRPKRSGQTDVKAEVNKIIASYYAKIVEDNMLTELSNMSLKINDIPANTEEFTTQNPEQINDDENESLNKTEVLVDDPSVIIENDNQDDETLQDTANINHTDDKIDKFNENIYDLKQLYVKVKNIDVNNIETEVSETVDNILSKDRHGITEIADEDMKLTENARRYRIDSEESEMSSYRNIQHYGYWIRHYLKRDLWALKSQNKKFNRELMNNFPNSFNAVLNHCAYICEGTTVELYTCLQSLEMEMAKFG